MKLESCTGTITSKIIGFTALLFLVLLAASLVHSFLSEKKLAEEFSVAQTAAIADSYFDGLNKLMLTGGMGERGELQKQVASLENVLEARVIRGDGIKSQYGPGLPDEAPRDELERAALAGKEVSLIEDSATGRRLTVIRSFQATEHTRGVNCLGCHSVPPKTVLGAIRVSLDLAPVDTRIRNSGLGKPGYPPDTVRAGHAADHSGAETRGCRTNQPAYRNHEPDRAGVRPDAARSGQWQG